MTGPSHLGILFAMDDLFRLSETARHDPAIDLWLAERTPELGDIARRCFTQMRECGDDVREAMHDGAPTACVADAAFCYVAVFKAHVNVGFFRGSDLYDPAGLLEGNGKRMRHVKLRPGTEVNGKALTTLINAAYAAIKLRLESA